MAFVTYRVETPRLLLRPWSAEDASALKATEDRSREHLRRFMRWADREPESIDEVIAKLRLIRSAFDADRDFVFGIWGMDGAICGGCGLHPRVGAGGLEIGYWIHEPLLRKGLATETAAALTRVAFEVAGARWVEIRCAPSNVASAGVPRKLGYSHEATLRERIEVTSGRYEDAIVFSLLARDYEQSAAKKMETRAFDAAGRRLL